MKKLIIILIAAGVILAAGDLVQAGFTGLTNPTASSPSPSNWGFNTPTGAYTDGMGSDGWSSAMAMPGTMQGKPFNAQQFYGYDFSSIPSGATINGIEVRMDVWRSIYATTGSMAVELSWDGGTSWTTAGYGTGTLNYGETTYYKGSASDTWGHAWTADEITNGFRVRQIATVTGNQSTAPRVYLDWIPVGITYTASAPVPPAVVPAPAAILLGSVGVVLVGWLRRRRAL